MSSVSLAALHARRIPPNIPNNDALSSGKMETFEVKVMGWCESSAPIKVSKWDMI